MSKKLVRMIVEVKTEDGIRCGTGSNFEIFFLLFIMSIFFLKSLKLDCQIGLVSMLYVRAASKGINVLILGPLF